MAECVEWCKRMMDKASEEGNFEDWSNYNAMKELWERRMQ